MQFSQSEKSLGDRPNTALHMVALAAFYLSCSLLGVVVAGTVTLLDAPRQINANTRRGKSLFQSRCARWPMWAGAFPIQERLIRATLNDHLESSGKVA